MNAIPFRGGIFFEPHRYIGHIGFLFGCPFSSICIVLLLDYVFYVPLWLIFEWHRFCLNLSAF